ncbi:MAG: ATP-binding cassette domain-containing protein [Lachnospiraceae bacterium]|nr:ATP-binding cassette domain-containing protein [Lachnospiraceae bacterium]MDY5000052.1 ATP-binding cassette domain-containing protein [Lachnospiraceae bacterium]
MILTVKDLHVSYKNRKKNSGKTEEREVLKGLSFNIDENEIVGLVGESGCGKSTLAKALLGLIKSKSGEIKLDCKHPQMVFQDPYSSLNPKKKISFILEEPLKNLTDMTAEERRAKAEWILGEVGLGKEYLDRYPSELSGGQRQRVCIAESMILGSNFLILDEPVSALDVTIQAQVLELIRELKEKHRLSILFISHDLRVVYSLCDRVMILKDGLIVEQGDRENIYRNPQHEYTKKLLKSAGITI